MSSPAPATAWIFCYFTGDGEDGLRPAWSADGWQWHPDAGGRAGLAPRVGRPPLMRDPHLARRPDGRSHHVWTMAWESREIGDAASPDRGGNCRRPTCRRLIPTTRPHRRPGAFPRARPRGHLPLPRGTANVSIFS
jgi:hypothetical protein